jgi:osmoprotectant transport system permease protein
VGQPSLGDYIFSGLQTEDWVTVLFGCAAAAGLALVADQLLGVVEHGAAKRDRRRLAIGLGALAAGVAVSLAPLLGAGAAPVYRIGAKNFSEQFILAELIAGRLGREDARAELRSGLGSAVIYRALAAGDIDVYVDYSGTLWTNVLGRKDIPERKALLAQLGPELDRRDGVVLLGSLGFENSYALTMRAERAEALGVRTLEDLARRAPELRLGADLEFLNRPEWAALRDAYGLRFRASRAYTPTFMYRALENGDVDVISAFSSDGRLAGGALRALADPKGAAPSYDAVLLISPERAADRRLRRALAPLVGGIPVERMRAANSSVDVQADKQSPAQAAAALDRTLK